MTPAEIRELLHEDKNLGWRAESVIRWLMDRVLKLEREVKRLKRPAKVSRRVSLGVPVKRNPSAAVPHVPRKRAGKVYKGFRAPAR